MKNATSGRNSFVVRKDWGNVLRYLPADICKDVVLAMFDYHNGKEAPRDMKPWAKSVFESFRSFFDEMDKKYARACEQRREAGKKSAEKRQRALTSVDERSISLNENQRPSTRVDFRQQNQNQNQSNANALHDNIDKPNGLSHCEKIAGGEAAPKKPESLPAGFVAFWAAYPRKRRVAKHTCLQKWKLHKFEAIAERIIADVRRQSASEQWTRDDGQYAPMPSTYLNQRRWEDGAVDSSDSSLEGQIGGVLCERKLFSELSEAAKEQELKRRRLVRLIAAGLTNDKSLSGTDIAAFSAANATDIEEAKNDPRTPLGWQPRKDRLYRED